MKFCKDCKHLVPGRCETYAAKCQHPKLSQDLVTGKSITDDCGSLRKKRGWFWRDYCGPEGRWWEAKDEGERK